ncbi:MAG: hypothetical protein N4A47_03850 [Clostridia bacterium]|jgi:hypothetical protein|nr:hypothetical protein [Clostridia bacterium]
MNGGSLKSAIGTVIAIILVVGVKFGIREFMPVSDAQIQQDLEEMIAKENEAFPQVIEEVLLVEKMEVLEDKTILFKYKFLYNVKEDFEDTGALVSEGRKAALENLSNGELSELAKYGVKLSYIYKDMNEAEIASFIIMPDEYKEFKK